MIKYLQTKNLSKSTITAYNKIILEFITWCDIQNVESENATSTDVMSYLNYLQKKGQQNKTRNVNLGAIKHYFNYLMSIEVRIENPARQIKLQGTKTKKLYNLFTKQELENIYHNYKTENKNENQHNKNINHYTQLSKKRNKIMIGLIINQALTTDEINRLTTTDIKLKEGKIYIQGTRKSNERELELKSNQIMELMEYEYTTRKELLQHLQINERHCDEHTRHCDEGSNLYFIAGLPTPTNKTITKINHCQNVWKRLSQEIKTTNLKFKNFLQVRTSVIMYWLQKYNLREVQYKAGHRYVSTTESYQINNIEDLVKNIEEYHPIN